jgi:hypothetical protein
MHARHANDTGRQDMSENMQVGEAGRTCQWERQAVQAEFLHRHDIQYSSDSWTESSSRQTIQMPEKWR